MCTDKQAREFFNNIGITTVAKISTSKIVEGWRRLLVQRFAPHSIRLAWMSELEKRDVYRHQHTWGLSDIPMDAGACHWCGGDQSGLELATLHLEGGYFKALHYECSQCKAYRAGTRRAPAWWQAAHRRLLER